MGNKSSKSKKNKEQDKTFTVQPVQYSDNVLSKREWVKPKEEFKLITENYKTYSELEEGLRKAGLESSQLIVGVDFTKSNTWQGGYPYYKYKNLHEIDPKCPNPYQQVLTIMCKTLAPFDDDQLIDAFGFGDNFTKNNSVFPFLSKNFNGLDFAQQCDKLEGVLDRYNSLLPLITPSGPTSFAPIIRKATELVKSRKEYHILLIIADGAVDDMDETIKSIVEASKHPLSIICIGVGKGPWHKMTELDINIPKREFDNFHFVNFYEIMNECENEEIEFAKHAMMEIPEQYTFIKNFILSR